MATLKPWYRIDGLVPRADLREGKPLDASEFAVHLDDVRRGTAPADYIQGDRFFDRTYLTKYLTELSAQVLRRLAGETTGTNAIFNLSTQFGGGKTHSLATLYHLANNGSRANKWTGVNKILQAAGLNTVPAANVAVFVGTEFDSTTGRGGDDGTPKRRTPWGEIAYQLGGEAALKILAEHEADFIEPKGDVIRALLPKDKPNLILMDEIINYVSTYRKKGYNNQLYNFVQSLSEVARGSDNLVLVVSIPASELEYTPPDEADEQRYKKMLDRLGKAIMISAESETSEIIRRRLFEWNPDALTADGRIMLPKDAINTCHDYADWMLNHRQQIPSWFPVDNAKEAFKATYPFHPSVFSVFERKWQALPRFQRTRGILRLLAAWVSKAYQEGYQGNHRDPLIGLGTAPLDDPLFRAAAFDQLGTDKLEGAVTTDICGKNDAHALRLDHEADASIKKARLHRKVATTIFFESNGGQSNAEATTPEIRLAVAEPALDIANVETVLEALRSECYYLTVNQTRYRFNIYPNLNKLLADRRANISGDRIHQRLQEEIRKVFPAGQGLQIIPFPTTPSNLPNQAALTLAVLDIDYTYQDLDHTRKFIETLVREAGLSARTYKSALLFSLAENDDSLREEARKLLAWEDIRDEQTKLDEEQHKQLSINLQKSQRDLREAVWRSYKRLALLDRNNEIKILDLGLITSSAADSLVKFILNRLRSEDIVTDAVSPNFLVRNWSIAFSEWSTKSIHDAFFASPIFPRLLSSDAVKQAIARGIKEGKFAYCGRSGNDQYEPFIFQDNISPLDIEISDDVVLIKAEKAALYQQKITKPPVLEQLVLNQRDIQLKPGETVLLKVEGRDQYGGTVQLDDIHWEAEGAVIKNNGVLVAGEKPGSYTVVAEVNNIQTSTTLNILSSDAPVIPPPPPPPITDHLKWQGSLNPQKWSQFYLKILSKFATNEKIQMDISINLSLAGDISEQTTNEIKNALQELGLNSDFSDE
ncbi:ATP-binding protein [Picosynechococcus sp. PCC 7117]|uniref:ATP-binding protein n=1 Tax=Picosynechococcus sp. PCC 7117 TaxID=195498 RepID=UPI000810607C|nr:DUF499 domain-containing protein [Picosynechococcus sp. PCC 7117]ANV88924.1 AAA family ATPase [Picosynechococcus sp. PCC 7117]